MKSSRKLKIDPNFTPCELKYDEECYPNGIFRFNISRIIEDIESGKLQVVKELIDVPLWYRNHCMGKVNEDHMPNVVLSQPIIQAEIKSGFFEIIDGYHRMEKARREKIQYVDSFKLMGPQLINYFIDEKGYQAYVRYWNDWLMHGGNEYNRCVNDK